MKTHLTSHKLRLSKRGFSSVFFILFFCLLFSDVSAQTDSVIPCITTKMSKLHGFNNPDPGIMQKNDFTVEDTEIYYIPVVFHIIFSDTGKGPDMVTDSNIISQIQVLNEDFGKMPGTHGYNTYVFGADTRIRFRLAQIDPYGNKTSGIERKHHNTANISESNEMDIKNVSRWDQRHYLNIWVVDEIDGDPNTAGYSYLAHDVSNKDSAQQIDGTVINYRFIGKNTKYQNLVNYKLGRTVTHEIGHYCDLLHTWGDEVDVCGDDGVPDTPPCENAYYSQYSDGCDSPYQCPDSRPDLSKYTTDLVNGKIDSLNYRFKSGKISQVLYANDLYNFEVILNYARLVADYMDYSDDRCMNVFTKGQANRMRGALRQYRPNLISCPNYLRTGIESSCEPTSTTFAANDVEIIPNPTISTNINFFLYLDFEQKLDFFLYDNLGRELFEQERVTAGGGNYTMSVPGLKPGIYYAVIKGQTQSFRKKILIIGN